MTFMKRVNLQSKNKQTMTIALPKIWKHKFSNTSLYSA